MSLLLLCALVSAPDAVAVANQNGPYAVETRTVDFFDAARGDRRLRVTYWYPSATEAAKPPATLPVVAFSHGSGANRMQSTFLTKHWASHGYVVLAPDHLNNTALDGKNGDKMQSALDRPVDMTFVIDKALEQSKDLGPRLDESKIAIAGHSFGAYTALVLGGAEVDGPAAARRLGKASIDGAFRHPDSRIRAVIAYAPIGPPILTPESLQAMKVPTLVFGGGDDRILPFEQHQAPVFENLGGPAYLARIEGGSHFSFNDAVYLSLIKMVKPERLIAERVERPRSDSLVRAISLAFLERHLQGNDRFAGALANQPPELTLQSRRVAAKPAPMTSVPASR